MILLKHQNRKVFIERFPYETGWKTYLLALPNLKNRYYLTKGKNKPTQNIAFYTFISIVVMKEQKRGVFL
ncbi:hypothetical protein CWR48_13605 [Oceanobacillus arenosus]|uniref:Uncharacterized protein n=1 Tax=Oceanobacillus arenosus TaxID=1229153 RepID=A0A3D8PRG7_9BACI|nr:hypothetical protein CWR48_13605 [Oceanobacillus arenosus]